MKFLPCSQLSISFIKFLKIMDLKGFLCLSPCAVDYYNIIFLFYSHKLFYLHSSFLFSYFIYLFPKIYVTLLISLCTYLSGHSQLYIISFAQHFFFISILNFSFISNHSKEAFVHPIKFN